MVELGRFVTGFMVVMGVGEYTSYIRWVGSCIGLLIYVSSITRRTGPLRFNPRRGDGHEHRRRTVDLRDDYKFYHVLPRARGVLR